MKEMKTDKLLLAILAMSFGGFANPLQAQEADSDGGWSLTVGTDVVSGYWWQGLKLADASLQPSVSLDYEKGDFSLSFGAWGSKSLMSPHYNELDLSVGATWKQFGLTLTDYYDFSYGYFPYNEGHSLDVGLTYTVSEALPLTLSCNGLVLGNRYGDDLPLYIQLAYDFSIWEIDLGVVAGGVPMKSEYYETDQADFVNLGISAGHEFEFGSCTLPVSVQYNYNPSHDEHFFGGGIGFYFSTGL